MRTLFVALLVFKAIGICRSEDCDVRMWYLKLTSEGIFNREMTSDQITIKRMIDDLVATSKTDPKARKVDCEVLAMYLDMFKPESEEKTHESVNDMEEDTTELLDEQGNENTGHLNEIMDEKNHDKNIVDETITIDAELPLNDRNESPTEFEIPIPNMETKIDGEEENARIPTDTVTVADQFLKDMEILHGDETEVDEKDQNDDHTIMVDDKTEEIKVSLSKSQPEAMADATSREQLIDNGAHVANADKPIEAQNDEGGIGTQAKKESYQFDKTPETIRIKNVTSKLNTTPQMITKQPLCHLDIANIFQWQSKDISSHKFEAKNHSYINKTEIKFEYTEISEYNLNSCQTDSPNIFVCSPTYYLMHLSKSNALHFYNKEQNSYKKTSAGIQPKVGEIERQESLPVRKEGTSSVKTNYDEQSDTSSSKAHGVRVNTILHEDKSERTEYKGNEQPSVLVTQDERMRQSDHQESAEVYGSFHKENLNSMEINYQEPTESLQLKKKDPMKKEELVSLKAHEVSNIRSNKMKTQDGGKTHLDTLSISGRENKELYTQATKDGDETEQLDSATAKDEGNNEQLENLTTKVEDNKEKNDTLTKEDEKNVDKLDKLAIKNGEKKELETLSSKEEEIKEQIGTLETTSRENNTQIDTQTIDVENKEQFDIMTTKDGENKERTDTPTTDVKNKEQLDTLTSKDTENREQTDIKTLKDGENKERTDTPTRDVKNKEQLNTLTTKDTENKEQLDIMTTKDGENEERTDTMTTYVENKEQTDTLTTDVEKEEQTDILTSNVENDDQKDTLTTDRENKEQTDTLTTDVENKEQNDTLTTDVENKEQTDILTSNVENDEHKDTLTTDGENKEPTDTPTTDVANKEQLDTLTKKDGDIRVLDILTTERENNQQLDTLTTKDGENKEKNNMQLDKLVFDTLRNGEHFDSLVKDGVNKAQTKKMQQLENSHQGNCLETKIRVTKNEVDNGELSTKSKIIENGNKISHSDNGDVDESQKHQNMHTFKDYITAKTDEYTNKIQTLELMVIKLENQILTERLNKQNNSSTITDMEIHILKLENDLLRLNMSYNELKKEQDMLKKSNRGYLELDNKSQTSSSNKFPGIGNSVSGTSLSKEYQTKIMHLSHMLKNQSLTVDKLKSKSDYLEDQNRLLFQMVMNQTVLMSQIMSRVQDLTEQNLQHRAEAQQLRREIERTRVQTEHNDDQMPGHLAQFVTDGRSDERIHEREFPQETQKHSNPVANNVRIGPLHDFNMVVNSWCPQVNNTCHLGILMTPNCIPFSNMVWIRCQNDYINVNINKPNMKSGAMVNKKQYLNENEKPAISSMETYSDTGADANEDENLLRKEPLIQHGDSLIRSNDQKTEHVVNKNKDVFIETNDLKTERKMDKVRHVNGFEERTPQSKDNKIPNTDTGSDDKSLRNDVLLESSSKHKDEDEPLKNMKNNLENKDIEASTKKGESDRISSRDDIKNNTQIQGTKPHSTRDIKKGQSNEVKAQETKHQVGTNKQTGKSKESVRYQDNKKPKNPKQESDSQSGQKIKQNTEEKKQNSKAIKKEIKTFPIKYTSPSKSEPKDCYDHYKMGNTRNGVFRIKPHGTKWAIQVYCDMKNGGWTVVQKRQDGTTKFLRDWEEYKSGFGGIYGEHWLGNDIIHYLTNQDHYSLQIDLMDWEKISRVANYEYFMVEDEQQGYRIHVDGYSGDAGDGMAKHHQHKFSTIDVDNDKVVKEFGGSCAKRFSGAWWYYKCYMSNLNGKYYRNGEIPEKMYDGITWKPWTGANYSLRRVEMKIRPASVKTSDNDV